MILKKIIIFVKTITYDLRKYENDYVRLRDGGYTTLKFFEFAENINTGLFKIEINYISKKRHISFIILGFIGFICALF